MSDHTATPATDHGLPVTPFTHVTLADHETDDVILTIAFDWREGELLGTGVEGVKAGNRITYTLMGKAADLTLLLRQVSFDPTNHDGPGNPVTTRFDIALNDVHHAIGSTDHVEVVTTVTGPDTLDNVYIVDAANPNPVINEDANPAIGGFDRAIVSIDAYTLAAGQGVETLEAAASVDHGITLVGNDLANTVIGGIGNDTLEGGGVTGPVTDTNQDVLRGGLGERHLRGPPGGGGHRGTRRCRQRPRHGADRRRRLRQTAGPTRSGPISRPWTAAPRPARRH